MTIVLLKGGERYVFRFDDESKAETLRTIGRFASDPLLSFTWFDAAKLSQEVRSMSDRRTTVCVQ